MIKRYSDIQLIQGIISRDNKIHKYLIEKYYKKVSKYVQKNKGNKQDAEDVFQDSIITMMNVVSRNGFEFKRNFESYFTCIYINKWKKEAKRRYNINLTNEFSETLEFDEINMIREIEKEEIKKLVYEQITNLDEESRTILDMYYHQSKTMNEISEARYYKSANTAKTLKYNALIKLKDIVKSTIKYKILADEISMQDKACNNRND